MPYREGESEVSESKWNKEASAMALKHAAICFSSSGDDAFELKKSVLDLCARVEYSTLESAAEHFEEMEQFEFINPPAEPGFIQLNRRSLDDKRLLKDIAAKIRACKEKE